MIKSSGGKDQNAIHIINKEGVYMELILSIAFGAWFVASALFYGYMVRKGEKD